MTQSRMTRAEYDAMVQALEAMSAVSPVVANAIAAMQSFVERIIVGQMTEADFHRPDVAFANALNAALLTWFRAAREPISLMAPARRFLDSRPTDMPITSEEATAYVNALLRMVADDVFRSQKDPK